MFGVSDAGNVEMIPLAGGLLPSCRASGRQSMEQSGAGEDESARANEVKDAVRKLVDGVALHLSPPVDANLVREALLL